MKGQSVHTVPKQRKPARLVKAEEGTDFDVLLLEYYDAKAAKDEAEERYNAIKKRIVIEALAHREDETESRVEVRSTHGPPISITYKTSTRCDTGKLREEQPDIYTQYAYQTATWETRVIK